MAKSDLTKVRAAAYDRVVAEENFRAAIRAAYAAGESLRTIAPVAGVTHARIHQIVKTPEAEA